jgi:YebC/PmpR family DNA-binding regulatory protein
MAGHSQFKNIMHKKGRADKARSKLFSKLAREITTAAKLGLPDPAMNARLRTAVLAARAENMPKDGIERAIKKAAGNDSESYEDMRYEGYGPGGVAIIVETLTDNRNRTSQDIRHAFTRHGGNLGESGSTAWMFARKGSIQVEKNAAPDEDKLLEIALEAGAEDLNDAESTWEITSDPGSFTAVRDAIDAAGIPMLSAELTMLPQNTVPVEGGQAKQVLALLEALEELDDVQNVYANFDIPESVMAELG